MRYSREDVIRFCLVAICFVLLYLTLKELRVALGMSQVSAQTPCSTPTASPTSQPSATPSASPSPSPTPLVTNVIIMTEFMACPASGSEWLELYNSDDMTIEVTGWQVIDSANNKKTLTGSVLPHTYTSFEWSGSLLNNTGDSFKLVTASGQQISAASYESCSTGISFVYENGQWVGAIESPNQDTQVSENTVAQATQSAITSSSISQSNSDSDIPNIFSLKTLSDVSRHTPPLPKTLTVTTPEHEQELAPPKNTELTHSSVPLASAISAIMGGLLQLLPGSLALYESYFKSNS